MSWACSHPGGWMLAASMRHGWRRRARHHGFGPWGARGRFFGPGELRLALLSLLAEGPQHGYELMRRLEERSGGVYRASAGSVYPTLSQLEDEGRIASEARDGKRVYRLTADGERELAREADAVREIWERAERWRDWSGAYHPAGAEIARPLERIAKAAFRAASRGRGDPGRTDRVRDVLERALRELEDLEDREARD